MEHRHRCARPNLLRGGLILRLQRADSDAKAYCYCDGQCDCNGNSLNSNIYSRSKLHSDSCRYSYCDPNPGQMTLTARGYKMQGRHTVDLTRSGATSSNLATKRNAHRHRPEQ